MDKPDRFDPEDDDIIPYLFFSEPEPLPLPPPPPPPPDHCPAPPEQVPDTAHDDTPPGWSLNYLESLLQGLPDLSSATEEESSSRSNKFKEPVFVQFQRGQLDCSGCLVLRELMHSNGFQHVTIAVHGGSGFFTHATFEIESAECEMGEQPMIDLFFIDLSMQTGEWVEGFLRMYLMLLDVDDSIVLKDNVTSLYNTLCANIKQETPDYNLMKPPEEAEGTSQYTLVPLSDLFGNTSQTGNEADSGARDREKMKTGLALQRQRAHNMSLKELAEHFHLPIADAARKLQLCSTAIKHACRRNGVARWPSRKIKSIDRQIANLEIQLPGSSREEIMEKMNEIEALKAKRERLYSGLES